LGCMSSILRRCLAGKERRKEVRLLHNPIKAEIETNFVE